MKSGSSTRIMAPSQRQRGVAGILEPFPNPWQPPLEPLAMTIHSNSLASYASLGNLGDRQRATLACYWPTPLTDREVSTMLGIELYQARPRVTELIALGLLREIGSQKDPITGRKVRIVEAV